MKRSKIALSVGDSCGGIASHFLCSTLIVSSASISMVYSYLRILIFLSSNRKRSGRSESRGDVGR